MADSSNAKLYDDEKLKSDPEAEREHVTLHRVESVTERVDSRLDLSSRPTARQLDSSISQQLFHAFHHEHHDHSKVGVGGDEAIHGVLDMMNAGVTYDVLQRAVPIHPTVSELLPTLLGDLQKV